MNKRDLRLLDEICFSFQRRGPTKKRRPEGRLLLDLDFVKALAQPKIARLLRNVIQTPQRSGRPTTAQANAVLYIDLGGGRRLARR